MRQARDIAPARIRPPRLVLRFALLSGVALVLAAGAGVWLARSHAIERAKDATWSEARFVADRLGRDDLARTAVRRPAYGDDVAQLDELFAREALGPGVEGVTLYARDGRITYASDHRRIGARAHDPARVERALAGERVSGLSDGVLESYVPVRWLLADPTFPTGVLAVARDYRPVAAEARRELVNQGATLALALLLLYAATFPILRRVTRALALHNRRLTEQAQELEALTEQASDAIIVCDAEGVVLEANEQASHLVDRPRAALRGRSFAELVDPDDLAARPLRLDELRAGRTVLHERRLRRADGELVVGELHARMLDDRRIVASIRDVSQLRRAQRAEAVGRLAGGVAHDFNNLLTGIAGYSDFLLTRLPAGDPLRREAEEIKKAAARGASLTRQLLVFGRRRVEQPALVDLNEALGDAQKLLGRLLGEDVAVTVEPAPEPVPVEVDPGRLEQAIVTLALSARESMPGGGALALAARTEEVKGAPHVVLVATDTGTGHGRDIVRELQEPYARPSNSLLLGPGLAYVAAMAQSSGGKVDVLSREDETTVSVYLPRADAPVVPLGRPLGAAGAARGSETILVVEDEELVRAVIREILEEAGYAVLGARHGRQALELAERHDGTIDLLLTDLVMPELGGRELAAELEQRLPGLSVVYMSGYPDDTVVAQGVLDPSLAFLQKPFTHDALERKVREALDGPDEVAVAV